MQLDLLAFGPHPDDVEIGVGGMVAAHAAAGFRVGVCDLTRGELGTNGTPEERLREAEAARVVLGVAVRENLGWPDGGIGREPEHLGRAVDAIRKWRPRTVLVPWWDDRHPDHRAASELLTRAVFCCGLRRFAAGGEPWKPDWVCYYFINDSGPASFVIDVSAHYDAKRGALDCHRTQFQPPGGDLAPTRLNSPRFRQLVESRDAHFGAQIGAAFAEGLVVRGPLERPHALRDWRAAPSAAPREDA